MAEPIPVFAARVTGGRLVFGQPLAWARTLGRLEGKFVEVICRPQRSKRSTAQNAWWHGVAVEMVAEECGYDRHDHETLHYALVAKCFGTTEDAHGLAVPNKRSSKLSTAEFSELMEWVIRWAAAELHIRIPLPDECDFEEEP
jgi:hypothetical protein